MIKMVVFDLDGTLYDYHKCNDFATNELIETISIRFGLAYDSVKRELQSAKSDIKKILGNSASSHNRILYVQRICERIRVNPVFYTMELYDIYWNTFFKKMELYDYVVPLFSRLKDMNIAIGMLTDLTAHIQYRKIIKLGIDDAFDYIVTSEETGQDKPATGTFTRMIEKTPFEPYEVLMVGDSPERDVQGAVTAGWKALLYENQHGFTDIVLKLCKDGLEECTK